MIRLHYLNFSRSFRVLWLLEELGLRYDLVRYERDATFRAPPELKTVHPLGKAPVIQDGDLTLAESAPILRYIAERHGEGRFLPADAEAQAVHDEWLQYAESSAALPIMLTMLGARTGGLPQGLAAFASPEVTKTLDYIRDGIGDGPYLLGDAFTLADIQMPYILEIAKAANLLADHPQITAYLDRLAARPGYAKALEIGGPMMPPRNEATGG